jgi:hypothetical protein
MKRYDKDEIQGYVWGSDLWAALNDRVLVQGVNDEQFWQDLFEGTGGKSFKKNLDCPENRLTLIQKYQQINGNEPIVRSHLNELAYRLMISGNPCFIYPHFEPEAPADDRPRDSLGRIMSPKALLWREFETWCSDPERKMSEIESLRRSNPDFQEFYSAQNKLRLQENADAIQSVQPTKKAVPAEVQRFAAEYRTMPTDRLRTLLSPGRNPLGPADAARAQSLYDAALSAGLI